VPLCTKAHILYFASPVTLGQTASFQQLNPANMIKLLPALFLIGLFGACNPATKEKEAEKEAISRELTDTLNKITDTLGFNGFSVVLVSDTGVLYQHGFGYANVATREKYTGNTLQNIASISKTFIGIALLKAQELGKLKLDDPINKYLPFRVDNPHYPEIPITIRHLATHTAGINDTEDYLFRAWVLRDTINLAHNLKIDIGECKFSAPDTKIPMEDFLKNVLVKNEKWYKPANFSKNKPGAIYEYSNMGATLAALVIEKATGTPYDQFTKKYILDPLNMQSSGWGIDAIDLSKHTQLYINKKEAYPFYSCITYPDGSMITSSADFSKYMAELMKGYFGKGSLLSKESYAEYFKGQLNEKNFIKRTEGEYSDEYNMGITMGISSTGNFGHTGGDPGLFSMMFFNPKTRIGKYMIVNTDLNDPRSWGQHYSIWTLLDSFGQKFNQPALLP
jgi:CubicO group peptidase (beta-lactamase class C family)